MEADLREQIETTIHDLQSFSAGLDGQLRQAKDRISKFSAVLQDLERLKSNRAEIDEANNPADPVLSPDPPKPKPTKKKKPVEEVEPIKEALEVPVAKSASDPLSDKLMDTLCEIAERQKSSSFSFTVDRIAKKIGQEVSVTYHALKTLERKEKIGITKFHQGTWEMIVFIKGASAHGN